MLDILIHHIVHLTFFDYTLPVLQNFEKTIWVQKTWIKFNQVFWHKLFSQSSEELAKYSQNMSDGQCDVSKRLAYRHILKSIVKELKEKRKNSVFLNLN